MALLALVGDAYAQDGDYKNEPTPTSEGALLDPDFDYHSRLSNTERLRFGSTPSRAEFALVKDRRAVTFDIYGTVSAVELYVLLYITEGTLIGLITASLRILTTPA